MTRDPQVPELTRRREERGGRGREKERDTKGGGAEREREGEGEERPRGGGREGGERKANGHAKRQNRILGPPATDTGAAGIIRGPRRPWVKAGEN